MSEGNPLDGDNGTEELSAVEGHENLADLFLFGADDLKTNFDQVESQLGAIGSMAAELKAVQEKRRQEGDLDQLEFIDGDIERIETDLKNAFENFQIGDKTINLGALSTSQDYIDKFNNTAEEFNNFIEYQMVGRGKRSLNGV